MKTRRTRCWLRTVALAALSIVPFATASTAQSTAEREDPGTYGRVRYAEYGLTIRRSAESPVPEERVTNNAPIFPGDSVSSDRSQRAEIELASGTLVRVAEETELTFLALPDPYAEVADHTVLQIQRGTARVVSRLAENQELRFDTPTASIYALGGGEFRVDVAADGTTAVASLRGVVEVAGSGGSVVLRGGMRTEVLGGDYPADPTAFNTFARDGFDRWVVDREQAYTVQDRGDDDAYDEIPQEVQPYYRELSSSGRWVRTDDYGYAWYPSGVSATWRPYYDGYWSYGPSGYFWVSSEPWGWAPYHYGRWAWSGPAGWCWIPGRVFAGAWVAWSWGSVHIGWAPLGYWNQPVYYHTPYYGYYDPACWTFVSYSHFHHHTPCSAYAVPYGDVDVRNHVVAARAPNASPDRLARSSEARVQAVREARATSAGRVQSIERGVRPTQTMRDVESRRVANRGTSPASAGRATASRFPRQLTGAGDRANGLAAGRALRPSARSDRQVTGEADRRVRDLYQRMASPRTTREGTKAGAPQASPAPRSKPGASAGRGKATAPRSGTSAAPRRTTGPAATPRPAPNRSSIGVAPTVTERGVRERAVTPRSTSSQPRASAPRPTVTEPRVRERAVTPRSTSPQPRASAPSARPTTTPGRSAGESGAAAGKTARESARGRAKEGRKD